MCVFPRLLGKRPHVGVTVSIRDQAGARAAAEPALEIRR
jgi:hypothetical protein